METVVLAGQCVLVGLLAGWLALGAIENIRRPWVNRDSVSDVLAMRTMRDEWPDTYRAFRSNRIEDARLHRLIFSAIVAAESIVAVTLVAGTAALGLALFELIPTETARIVAALGVLGFTAIWGAFLVGGQWVHYWVGHEGTQHSHFLLALWGVGTWVALV